MSANPIPLDTMSCLDCTAAHVSHASLGVAPCNGCPTTLCPKCLTGARYFCPLRAREPLDAPTSPLVRQEALGVQSPKAETKKENK